MSLPPRHRLWKNYRRAIFSRDDFQAFDLIPSILQGDPGNKDALAEQQRLGYKLSRQLVVDMAAAIQSGNPKQAAMLLRRRKKLPGELRPRSDEVNKCWELALPVFVEDTKREVGKLVARARDYRMQGDLENWKQVDELLKDVGVWCESVGLDPERDLGSDSAEVKALKEWADAGRKRERIRELIEVLRQLVGQTEDQCRRARWRDVKSLRVFLTQLSDCWKDITSLDLPIPPEASALYESGRSSLQRKIVSLQRKRTLAVTVSMLAITTGLVFAGVGVMAWIRAQRIIDHLHLLQQTGQVGRAEEPEAEDAGAEGYVRFVEIHDPYMSRWGVVAPVLDTTTNWIKHVRVAQQLWGERLDGLQPLAQRSFSMFEGSAVTNLIAKFAEAVAVRSNVVDAVFQFNPSLPAELNEEVFLQRTQLGERNADWQKYCAKRDRFYEQEGARLSRELKELLVRGEAESGSRPFGNALRSLRSVRQSIQAISDVLVEYKKTRGPRLPQIRIPDELDLQRRADDLEKVRTTMQSSLEEVDQALGGMRNADSTEEYLKALRSYSAAGKALSLQETRAAEIVGRTLLNTRQLIGAILMPHDAAGFEFFCSNPAAGMVPTNVTAEERTRFLILRDDDNLRNVYKYNWMPYNMPQSTGQVAYSIGPGEERSRIGTIIKYGGVFPYCPDAKTQGTIACRGPGVKSPESELFERCGVGLLADSKVSRFTTPILRVIDMVEADTQASPLFKAYLQIKLYEFLALRPRDWGTHWLVALRTDHAQLLSAGADGLQSEDWMMPGKNQARLDGLEKYYRSHRGRSYIMQAEFIRELVSSVYFQHRYAGFVDDQGVPQVRSEIEGKGELWGLEQRTLKPTLLFRAGSGRQHWVPVRTAQAMTPLLLMPLDKASMLERNARTAGLKLDDPTKQWWLPPFFQAN